MNILIIKLGALGDVLRTTAILPGIKRKWPECEIDWVVDSTAHGFISRLGYIRNTLAPDQLDLGTAKYDLAINLDESGEAIQIIENIKANSKMGISKVDGRYSPLNSESSILVDLIYSDRMKFSENQFSYPRLLYIALGLSWENDRYQFEPSEDATERLGKQLGDTTNKNILGIYIGASSRFSNKFLSTERIAGLYNFLNEMIDDYRIVLLGGVQENEQLSRLKDDFGIPDDAAVALSEVDDLAAVISGCACVILGDTFPMHLAIAQKVPVVTLFGPTSHTEIDLYSAGVKVISSYSCGPCYKTDCTLVPNCMTAITDERIVDAVKRISTFKN